MEKTATQCSCCQEGAIIPASCPRCGKATNVKVVVGDKDCDKEAAGRTKSTIADAHKISSTSKTSESKAKRRASRHRKVKDTESIIKEEVERVPTPEIRNVQTAVNFQKIVPDVEGPRERQQVQYEQCDVQVQPNKAGNQQSRTCYQSVPQPIDARLQCTQLGYSTVNNRKGGMTCGEAEERCDCDDCGYDHDHDYETQQGYNFGCDQVLNGTKRALGTFSNQNCYVEPPACTTPFLQQQQQPAFVEEKFSPKVYWKRSRTGQYGMLPAIGTDGKRYDVRIPYGGVVEQEQQQQNIVLQNAPTALFDTANNAASGNSGADSDFTVPMIVFFVIGVTSYLLKHVFSSFFSDV